MAYPPGLVLHGKGYRVQKRIPQDCLKHFDGKTLLYHQTGLQDKKEAAQVAWQWLALQEQEFERLRNPDKPLKSAISLAEMQGIVDKMVYSRIASDGAIRNLGHFAKDVHLRASHQHRLMRDEEDVHNALALGDYEAIEGQAQVWLKGHGYELPIASSEFRTYVSLFAEGISRVNTSKRERLQGKLVDEPKAPAQGSTLTLSHVIPKWTLDNAPKLKTIGEWEYTVKLFHELHTALPLDQIEKRHIVAFKDNRLEAGLSAATVTKHLSALKSLLQYSVDNDLLSSNVASGVRVRGAKVSAAARLPYSIEDLNIIFSSPIYTEGKRPRAGAGEASYWIPLIGLYTGARMEEIGQLTRSDIRQTGDVWYFHISNEGEETSVKNKNSNRDVPIHPELIRLGFLKYVESHDPGTSIFPKLSRIKGRQLTHNYSKWWGNWCRLELGITDTRKVFHSFRHAFKDACRNSGIPREIHDAFTGHVGSDVGSTYGVGHSVKTLGEAMGRVRYEGLVLQTCSQA